MKSRPRFISRNNERFERFYVGMDFGLYQFGQKSRNTKCMPRWKNGRTNELKIRFRFIFRNNHVEEQNQGEV